MAPVDFYEDELDNGTRLRVVQGEFDLLVDTAEPQLMDCLVDLLAALGEYAKCRSCDEAGLVADVSLTGSSWLFHYIDTLHSKAAVLFTVTLDSYGGIEGIVALKFCRTASSHISVADIGDAKRRLSLMGR